MAGQPFGWGCGVCACAAHRHMTPHQQQQQTSLRNLQTMHVPSRRAGAEDIWWWTHAAGSSKESTAMEVKATATKERERNDARVWWRCMSARTRLNNDHSLEPHRQQCVGERQSMQGSCMRAHVNDRHQGGWQVHASGPAWELWLRCGWSKQLLLCAPATRRGVAPAAASPAHHRRVFTRSVAVRRS